MKNYTQHVDIAQRTPRWVSSRVGLWTGSKVGALSRTKSGWSAAATTAIHEVAAERITGRAIEHYVTAAMQRGIDSEPMARDAYQGESGELVADGGWWTAETCSGTKVGASPDGLIGLGAVLEIKCPSNVDKHIEVCISREVPREYRAQCAMECAVTGRDTCVFVSYFPELTRRPLAIVEHKPSEDEIAALEALIDEAEKAAIARVHAFEEV